MNIVTPLVVFSNVDNCALDLPESLYLSDGASGTVPAFLKISVNETLQRVEASTFFEEAPICITATSLGSDGALVVYPVVDTNSLHG